MPEPAPLAAEPETVRQNRLRLSLVWIVPIVAVLIGIGLVLRSLLLAGPQITIEFRSADGIEARRTEVRFKEVVIGHVRRVQLRPDHQAVLVTVDLDKSAESLAVEDARFWIVRPRIGTGGVSGLSTLLSGAYIGVDAGASTEPRREFTGLDNPPLVLRDEHGSSFVLRADDLGSLDVGSPVYHRRVPVGRVVGYTLDADHESLQVQVFISAPYDKLVDRRSRFWNASGVELALNAGGLTLNTQSLVSMIAGGVAFADPPDAQPGAAVESGHAF
ncbi:MAG: MCE family protein, partial [Burkholderiales bacterium]|nr:MCE family protein [Burkholderiales bacterium]